MTPHVVLTCPHALGVPGGGIVHCRRLAVDLRRAGAEVTLMPIESTAMSMWPRATPAAESRRGPFLDRLVQAGVEIAPLRQHAVGWWFDGLRVRRALERLIAERPVDAALGWWNELAWSTSLLAARGVFTGTLAAAPYSLWWERRPGHPRWLHRQMDDRIVARTARRSDRVFANSAHTADDVASILGVDPRRIEIVHPPRRRPLLASGAGRLR